MAGGGGAKKKIINFLLDKPVQAYLGGGALLFLYRRYQTNATYNYHFGKFDFQRRVERNELHWTWSLKWESPYLIANLNQT